MKKIAAICAAALLFSACSSLQPVKERYTVDLRSPHTTAGSVEVQFDKFLSFGGLQKGIIDVIYYPAEDAVCLQYRIDFMTYYQFWNKINRAAFTSALQWYKTDYEQRNLAKNYMRTKRAYGTVRAYTIWETTRFSTQGQSHPNLEMGYYFKDQAPYFAITQREAPNENEQSNQSIERNSNQILYMTRAQAEDLAALFDQAYLAGLSSSGDAPAVEQDAYKEGL